jgi:hypothetical protein
MPLTEEQRLRNRAACKKWYEANKSKASEAYHNYAKSDWGRYAIREVQRRAKRRGIECTIDAAWLNEHVAPMVCEATGIPLIWDGPDKDNPWAPSVDRVQVSGGYTPDNTQVTCWAYNWAKGKWPVEVLRVLADAISEKE